MALPEGPGEPGDAVRGMRTRMSRSDRDARAVTSKRVSLRGTVEQGVEGRSVVLLDGAGTPLAQLLGWPHDEVRFGAEVRVTGHFVQGLSSGAQQGRPFDVESVEGV